MRITLGSEDVIHDYSIPAFRVKMDAVPGKLDDAVVRGDEGRARITSSAPNTAARSTPG